jgi:hypothetical protein
LLLLKLHQLADYQFRFRRNQKKERQKSIEAAEAAFNDLNTYFKTDAILFGD